MSDWSRYYVRRALIDKPLWALRKEYLAGREVVIPWIKDRPNYEAWVRETYDIDFTYRKVGFPSRRAYMMFLLRFS